MKRAVFFIVVALCLVMGGEAHAQRALKGMRGLELRGGMVDGFIHQTTVTNWVITSGLP